MAKICSRVVTCIGIHKHRQNGGRERKKEKFRFRSYHQLHVFDGKIIPEHCFKIAFSLSVSLVDLQGHWIKGYKFAFLHNLDRKMILSDTEGSRIRTLDDVSP